MPQVGNTWVNWEQFLASNAGQAQSQADDMYGQLDATAGAAQQGIADAEAGRARGMGLEFSDGLRGQVNQATDGLGAANAGTFGLQALYQRGKAGTGYTPGMGLYDAALTGSAGGSRFKGLRGKYRGLFGGLEAAQGRAATAQLGELSAGEGKGPYDRVGGENEGKERARLRDRVQDRLPRDRVLERGKEREPRTGASQDPDWFARWAR